MKTKPILISILSLAISSFALRAGIIGGPTINPNNGHTYFLLSSDTWTTSENESLLLGGHLATINDAIEQQWVFNTFIPQTTGTTTGLWIGLNDASSSGNFIWSSGETASFTYWFPGEPNNIGLEHYTYMVGTDAGTTDKGKWNNLQDFAQNGSNTLYGVVKSPPSHRRLFSLRWAALFSYLGVGFVPFKRSVSTEQLR